MNITTGKIFAVALHLTYFRIMCECILIQWKIKEYAWGEMECIVLLLKKWRLVKFINAVVMCELIAVSDVYKFY
jgi:hypothetical protein